MINYHFIKCHLCRLRNIYRIIPRRRWISLRVVNVSPRARFSSLRRGVADIVQLNRPLEGEIANAN